MLLVSTLDSLRARILGAGKALVERICGGLLLRQLPHGLDAAYDIGRWLPDLATIVDVGANVGQSSVAFAETWPDGNKPLQALTHADRVRAVHGASR